MEWIQQKHDFRSLSHAHIGLLSRRVRKVMMLTRVLMVRMLMVMMVTIVPPRYCMGEALGLSSELQWRGTTVICVLTDEVMMKIGHRRYKVSSQRPTISSQSWVGSYFPPSSAHQDLPSHHYTFLYSPKPLHFYDGRARWNLPSLVSCRNGEVASRHSNQCVCSGGTQLKTRCPSVREAPEA